MRGMSAGKESGKLAPVEGDASLQGTREAGYSAFCLIRSLAPSSMAWPG